LLNIAQQAELGRLRSALPILDRHPCRAPVADIHDFARRNPPQPSARRAFPRKRIVLHQFLCAALKPQMLAFLGVQMRRQNLLATFEQFQAFALGSEQEQKPRGNQREKNQPEREILPADSVGVRWRRV